MLRQGIKPNIVTDSALTSACEKGQDLIKAVRLFEDVRRQGIKSTFVTYSTLTSTCEKGQDLIQGVSENPQGLIGSHGGWNRTVFGHFSA